MMFLFAVPVMQGFGVYLVPLMVGTRQLVFPRLNAFGYWVYLIGCLLLWVSFAFNVGPDQGWFSYVPLAGPEFGVGKRVDVWSQMVTFTELSALAVAINIIATVLKLRAPGMALHRMPVFVWAQLAISVMVIFAMPAVMLSSGMLAADRLIGTQYFNQAEGGDPLLWQHLFWYFAHPEVYIIFLPATAFVTSIIVPFVRSQLFGYSALVIATVATAFVAFGVWVHHMFATGLPQLGQSFFTAASILITIPTGVQFFCWIATIRRGRIQLTTPMLFVLAFVATFLVGGLTGVMLASVAFAAGTLLTLWNVWRSYRGGALAGADPWGADSLEWATTSPPPDNNFDATPVVASRHPLWDQRPLPVARSGGDDATHALGLEGAASRTAALTGGMRAEPGDTFPIPEETVLPLVLALGITAFFVGLLVKVVLVGAVGVAIGVIALLAWAWRTGEEPS
jgi:heme/copper-type cytochrome/quinol oxidase subunit 1